MNRILVLINIAFVLISCSGNRRDNGVRVFRYNCENSITSLDPAFASSQDNNWAVTQLFNGLIQLNNDLEPQPAIAQNWEISDSGKIYTFHLRQDVIYHHDNCFGEARTRTVKASDFVFSFSRIMDPETASPGAWIFNDKVAKEPFQALDDSTLVIRLAKPFAPFIGILSMPYCMVIPPEAVDHYGVDFGEHPIGTGPFRFEQWERDVALHLNRFDQYFERSTIRGNLDAVQIGFVQNRQMALLKFLQGRFDMYSGITGAVKDYLFEADGSLRTELRDKVDLEVTPFLNTEYLAMWSDAAEPSPPFDDVWFRKALAWSIDREEMLHYLRNGVGRPADGGFIPMGLSGYKPRQDPFNLDSARFCLAQSKYHDNPPEIVLNTTRDYTDLCIYAQKQFESIGVKCRLNIMPSAQLKEEKRKGKLAFFRASWIMDYPDAENYLSCFYSPNFTPGGPNYTHFQSDRFDQLYVRSLTESNDSARTAMYHQMDDLILQDMPVILLFYDESVRLTQKRVEHWENNALNIPILKHVRIKPE
ncbi:MAG: ABC transporter substrate-binding protein [Flavobacteriales bacterium]|nr:ABC transporter substrate-binding protein [Bacteroidota bacterium]MCB9239630.1 ABC transporter substrate-binding protein [Flavobacteriales bacterium]